jgi:hypothetical protein
MGVVGAAALSAFAEELASAVGVHELFKTRPTLLYKAGKRVCFLAQALDEGRLKSGLGGLHIDSNHRLMYTWEWASPQKCRAPVAFAASEFQRCTVSCESPQ